MTRTRTLIHVAFAIAVICLSWTGVLMTIPTASADVLPNGYDVNCQVNGPDTICNYAGCPRVHDDLAGDIIHIKINGGPQREHGKNCGSTATTSFFGNKGFNLAIQGCRTGGTDDCGPWSYYTFTPPAAPAAPPPPPTPPTRSYIMCPAGSTQVVVGDGQQCTAAPKPDVICPAGSTTPTVPAGQSCTAVPAPKDAVTMNIDVGVFGANVSIASSADIAGNCTYNAKNSSGLPGVNKTFALAPNGSVNFSTPPPGLATYDVVLSCKGPFNGKTVEYGHAEQSVGGVG